MRNADDIANGIGTQHYATQLGAYDEMYAAENKVLPYWERFIGALESMGGEELELRRREAQRQLRENGVTYNVYANSQKLASPWRLAPVPLLIGGEEWSVIETGLMQRADLLDLILKDIYSGYALENRTVMRRVLSDIFRETQARRLSGFFKALRHVF